MKKNKKRPLQPNQTEWKKKNPNDFFTEEECGCTFVAGYTSWGFPYGTTIEEPEAIKDNEELPF